MNIEERSVNERLYKDVWLGKYDESLSILYSRYVNDMIYFVFKKTNMLCPFLHYSNSEHQKIKFMFEY